MALNRTHTPAPGPHKSAGKTLKSAAAHETVRPASRRKAASTAQKPGDGGALQRGLAIIDTLIAAEQPLSLSELSDTVGLTPSTMHRLLQTLIQSGYVYRDALSRFSPTPRSVYPLGLHHPLNMLRRDAKEPLQSLRDKYGPTATLSIFFDTRRLILETAPGDESFVPYFDTHLDTPFHATVSGKLLLSSLSNEARAQLLGPAPYAACTKNTITSEQALHAELDKVSAQQYATNLDEHCPGISAVGAPILLDSGMVLGAIVVTGPSKYFSADTVQNMVPDVMQTAHLFSYASPAVRAVCRFLGVKRT
ncbi:MAG: IclR family transcriptional regulator [Pusillimonas sp.]